MKTKELTPEKAAKMALKREKEIKKWEKEKARPKRNYYMAYLVLIICIIYATDEIASQIGTLMKTEIANDLFASFGESSVGLLDILSVLAVPFQALGLLYRPLADKYGRKKFLIINTFGMSIAMFIVFLSGNLVMYFIGACMVQFFVPHDMHVVYIMESAPSKNRATMYSVIKFFANISVMIVPLLRRLLMESTSQWRNVYLIPSLVGIVTCLIALLFARETDAFIDSRLAYLKMTDEDRAEQDRQKKEESAQGGLIPALKFALRHKQLRWLYITSAIANLGFYGSINYEAIMTYGYAQNFFKGGLFETLEAAAESVGVNEVTAALFLFPVGCAVSQLIMGFISDWKGRKTAAVVTAFDCLVMFVLFTVGANMAWAPYLVGFFCGAYIGSYYSTNDVIIMMIGESSPTNLRSSTMSAQFIVTAAGVVVSFVVCLPLATIMGNSIIGLATLCLTVPGFIGALYSLIRKTGDTKGIDMDTVTGAEWD